MCDSARKSESEKQDRQSEVGERCFREGGLACGCVPLYPLFIHSLLSQSLGNETGDGNEDLRGGSSLTPFIFFCSFHLSLSICSSPPHYLHLSMALDHFKMSGPSPQMAETEGKVPPQLSGVANNESKLLLRQRAAQSGLCGLSLRKSSLFRAFGKKCGSVLYHGVFSAQKPHKSSGHHKHHNSMYPL